jgi:hypothetical protein
MEFFHRFRERRPGKLGSGAVLAAAALAACLGQPGTAHAQAAPAAEAGGYMISAGVLGSGYYLQYGERKMLGLTAFVDADTKRRLGIEAEGRWLEFHQTANVHAETYSVGGRYHFDLGRFEPYAKGLAGIGEFSYPYNYAHGSYLVVTAGGGMDYALNRRVHIRMADFEYQIWPQFTYGAMTTAGVSAGIRVRIF